MKKLKTIGLVVGVLVAAMVAYGGASLWADAATPVSSAKAIERYGPDSHIVPHKALYKIEMVEKRSGAQILNISGDMYFEWKASCEAWTTDHRFKLDYEYADSAPMRITSDFTTYERYAGDTFDFNSRRYRDGELYQELRGRAVHPVSGKAGQAVYTMPPDLQFDLDPETLFPVAHTLSVLQAARSGKKFYTTTIFDGSDEEGPAQVTAFIGKPISGANLKLPEGKSIDKTLLGGLAWPIRLAFFPLTNEEIDSDYEMDIVLHDNGIISDMYVDYKDFSVTQKLVALEKAKPAFCGETRSSQRP